MFYCFGNFKSKYLSLSKITLNVAFLHEVNLFLTADERRVINVLEEKPYISVLPKRFLKGEL